MSAAVKIIKGVKGPRPKRSNVSSNSSSVQEDAVFVEARQHYQKAIATQCKIQDLKTFLSFLLQRGAYLENNHKEWLDKIFSEIRDLVRGKDVGPLHLTLLMQVVEMRAKDWKAGGSFEAYYREKIPVATQLQDDPVQSMGDGLHQMAQKSKVIKKKCLDATPLRKLRESRKQSELPVTTTTDVAKKPEDQCGARTPGVLSKKLVQTRKDQRKISEEENCETDEDDRNNSISLSATNELFRNLITSKPQYLHNEHDTRFGDLCERQSSEDSMSEKSAKSAKSVLEELNKSSRMRMDKEKEERPLKDLTKEESESTYITFSKSNAEVLMMKKATGFIGLMSNTCIEMVECEENSPIVLFKVIGKKANREKALKYMMERAGEKAIIAPQKVYEDKKQSTAATKPAIFATPRKTPSPGLQIMRSISLDSPRSSPAKDYSAGVRGVFADAKIRHNRESLNFECDIFLPSTFLVDIDDKTWHKLQRKTDSRIKLNQESSILHHISIQGPLKSNIRHCLEVLEELVVPDSDESEEELIAKPIVKLVQKQKSYPGHLEFENLRRSVRKASLEDEGFGSLSHEPRTSDYIIGSTSAHGDTAEQSLRVEPKTPNQERWTLSQRMVSSAQKATERRNDRSVSSSTTAVRALSTESQTWAERAIAAVPVAPVPKSQEYGLTRLPVTTQQSLDEDDSSVWDEGDEDIFLTELESRMGNLHLTKEDDDTSNKEQTSPFGKYGIMATIQKQRSKSESACTRQIGDLEKVARESALKSRRDEVKMASPRLVSAWPATPRKSSLPEKPLDWWRSPVPPSDDESSTTSGSGTIHQENKAEAEIKYDIDALLALASEPSSLQSPSSFVESWPTLVKLYPTVCLDEPWGFKPQNHKVPSEHQWPKSNRAVELTRSVSTEY